MDIAETAKREKAPVGRPPHVARLDFDAEASTLPSVGTEEDNASSRFARSRSASVLLSGAHVNALSPPPAASAARYRLAA